MTVRNIQLQDLVCEQPLCALQQGHMNRAKLADLLIRALSKDDSSDPMPDKARITPRSSCIECARSVIRGHQPLLTWAESKRVFLPEPPRSCAQRS